MDKMYYNEAMVIYETPKQFYDQAKLMLTDEEIMYIHEAKRDIHTVLEMEDIIAKHDLSTNPTEFIRIMYNKCILNKAPQEDGSMSYKVNNFYERFPYFAQFEHEAYTKIPRTIKSALNLWDFDVYFQRKKQIVELRMKGDFSYHIEQSEFMTLDETFSMLDRDADDKVWVGPCNCKCMWDFQQIPSDVCMHIGDHAKGINTPGDRGHGKVITTAQAKELIKGYNKMGLMQCGEPAGFCNCDELSCYPLHVAQLLGSKFSYPRSHYQIEHDEETCINCGKCVKICNFHAFEKDENGKVHYNKEKCWECTLCEPNCPKKAIHLIKKEENWQLPQKADMKIIKYD